MIYVSKKIEKKIVQPDYCTQITKVIKIFNKKVSLNFLTLKRLKIIKRIPKNRSKK